MISLSVVIITLNEEKNIGRCLQAVKSFADEILVVDSYSTDKTVEIAGQYGATVIREPFRGYVEQKNFADAQAKNDWILSIDADEVVSPELEMSIQKVKRQQNFNAYELNRLTSYCGHWIRHCGWYPDKKIRLFNRGKGRWVGEQIHESWQPYSSTEITGAINGDLFHYSYNSLSDHLKQIEKFTEIMARRDVNSGKTSSRLKAVIAAKWKFFQSYIIRLGFLDGYAGFQVCLFSAFATYIKYSKIHQYTKFKKEGKSF
ncbi:MAG TPA: glycosyltransferase family 2 protein [Flavipsychrobacter sp.]|nr:glycosyltransferase family 2 protein [Flavipsychrobacter sp.]